MLHDARMFPMAVTVKGRPNTHHCSCTPVTPNMHSHSCALSVAAAAIEHVFYTTLVWHVGDGALPGSLNRVPVLCRNPLILFTPAQAVYCSVRAYQPRAIYPAVLHDRPVNSCAPPHVFPSTLHHIRRACVPSWQQGCAILPAYSCVGCLRVHNAQRRKQSAKATSSLPTQTTYAPCI